MDRSCQGSDTAINPVNVEARESLVDRSGTACKARYCEPVEARESLVDRSLHQRVTFAEMRKSRLARALWIEVFLN